MTDMDDEKKRKRATKEQMRKRVDIVLDLMTRRRVSNRKITQLLMESENISRKTASRNIQKARKILAGIGSQSSAEERGLLWERVDDLYAAEQSSDAPNRALLNQILRTQLETHKTHPKLKGDKNDTTNTNPTADILSPELAEALKRLGIEDVAPQ